MKVIQEVNIDLINCGPIPTIFAMQGDDLSRSVKINLKINGQTWDVPVNASGVVRYKRADGVSGNYNTNPNGQPSVEFSESAAVVQLSYDMLKVPGTTDLTVAIISDDSVLHTFALKINVQENPGIAVSENDGFYLAGTLPDKGWEPEKYLGTDEYGNVVVKDAPVANQQQIQDAVNNYLDNNPVNPGATQEQIAQITTNKENIEKNAEKIQENSDAISKINDPVVSGNTHVDGSTYTLTMPRENGSVDTVVLEFDANGYISKVTENGREIFWTTTGV